MAKSITPSEEPPPSYSTVIGQNRDNCGSDSSGSSNGSDSSDSSDSNSSDSNGSGSNGSDSNSSKGDGSKKHVRAPDPVVINIRPTPSRIPRRLLNDIPREIRHEYYDDDECCKCDFDPTFFFKCLKGLAILIFGCVLFAVLFIVSAVLHLGYTFIGIVNPDSPSAPSNEITMYITGSVVCHCALSLLFIYKFLNSDTPWFNIFCYNPLYPEWGILILWGTSLFHLVGMWVLSEPNPYVLTWVVGLLCGLGAVGGFIFLALVSWCFYSLCYLCFTSEWPVICSD